MIAKKYNSLEMDIHLLSVSIVKELIVRFRKPISEAEDLVKNSDIEKIILKHPIALHDSAYNWAVKLLAANGDIETLENYLIK